MLEENASNIKLIVISIFGRGKTMGHLLSVRLIIIQLQKRERCVFSY